VVKHIEQQAVLHGKPLGGNNSELLKAREMVLRSDSGDIAKAVRDPSKSLCTTFGGC
jgi:putative aminopeptidase FrvX